MEVIYARQPLPDRVEASIFLAGPTPRSRATRSWRPEALDMLRDLGFSGHVFVPEDSGGGMNGTYDHQIQWETDGLHRSDVIVFWVPRVMADMPGLTTNDEWGHWKTSGKVVWGSPADAVSVKYQRTFCTELGVPQFDTLRDTLRAALHMIGGDGGGMLRQGPECWVPLHIWRTRSFQSWYADLRAAENRLVEARVRHALFVQRSVFLWTLWVDVFIAAEGRNKRNELVIGRPDVACTVVVHRCGASVWDAQLVLVREYRSAVSNGTGAVLELAGGSHATAAVGAAVAAEELHEELGLTVAPAALQSIGSARQLAPTLLSHKAHAFVLDIDAATLERFVQLQRDGAAFGNAHETERTHVVVKTVRELFEDGSVDWGTLGIVAKALLLPPPK